MKNWIAQYGNPEVSPIFQEGGTMPEDVPMEDMDEEMGEGMEMEGGEADIEGMIQEFIAALESGDEEAAKEIALETLLAILEEDGGEIGDEGMDVPEGMKGMGVPENHKPEGRSSKYFQNYMKGGNYMDSESTKGDYVRATDSGVQTKGGIKQTPGANDETTKKSMMKGGKKKYAQGGAAPRPMTALEKLQLMKG